MKLYKCEMCGKSVLRVDDHHVIPWYLSHDDSESNIMRLCASCHRRADANFVSLVMYGRIGNNKESSKRAAIRYRKKYMKYKPLYHVMLSKYIHYRDVLSYNIKTDVVRIIQRWDYTPNRNISRSLINHISGRRKMAKAATTKGQTILSGGGIK